MIEAPRNCVTNGRRKLHRLDLPATPPLIGSLGRLVPLRIAALAAKRTRFDQRLERLLDEKWISARPSIEKRGERSNRRGIDPEYGVQNFCYLGLL